jgi:hypothetical protein
MHATRNNHKIIFSRVGWQNQGRRARSTTLAF